MVLSGIVGIKVKQHGVDELVETIAHFELPFYRNLDTEALCADTLHKSLDLSK